MSGFEFNKIAGAILSAALVFMVVGFIGDALVQPKKHQGASMTFAERAPAEPKAEEVVEPIAVRLASASADAGEKVYGKCKACHDISKARKLKVGPPLWDIVMADKGAHGEYKYSSAMGGVGGKWTYENLDAFIASPRDYMKGTKMTFAGIKDAKDRANLIAFMRNASDAPKPLPK